MRRPVHCSLMIGAGASRQLSRWAVVTICAAVVSVADASEERATFTNSLGQELRFIEAGHFVRGDSADVWEVFGKDHPNVSAYHQYPAHPVRLTKPFYLSTTEVTVGQFRQFVEATRYKTTAEAEETDAVGFKPVTHNNQLKLKQPFNRGSKFTWRNPGFEQTDDHPVVCVSWQDAQAYCRWLTETESVAYRLPTEAEWEYACRARASTAFSWGNDYLGTIHQRANAGNAELEKAHEDLAKRQWLFDIEHTPGDGYVYTAPVASFPANDWGMHDMHGNVWEWCQDTFGDTVYKQYESPGYPHPRKTALNPLNETPWNEFGDWRVMRGGSWYTAPALCRADIRRYFDATDAACYIGFRVVRAAPQAAVDAAEDDWAKEQIAIAKVKSAVTTFHAYGNLQVRRSAQFHQGLSDEAARDLYRIAGLAEVQWYSSIKPTTIEHLSKIAGLTSLQLHNMTDIADVDIAPLSKLKSLERLTLAGRSRLTDKCVVYLTGLKQLRRLQLSGGGLTDAGLSQFRQLKQLEELHLEGTQAQGAILSSLGDIPLKRLVLPDLTDDHAARLAGLSELKTLRCRGPSLTDRGFARFAGLQQLTELDLSGCRGITSSGFSPLASMTKLRSLNLSDTWAGDEAVKHLAQHHRISSFSIGADLTDEGMPAVCNLISLTGLSIVGNAKITDEGLVDFWRLRQLINLTLHADGLTGSGFAPLAEAARVGMLRIRSKNLTDEALKHISALPNLGHLEIHGTNESGPPALTDRGLLLLADADKLRHLRIDARGTQVTEAAIEQLKRANPELRVEIQR